MFICQTTIFDKYRKIGTLYISVTHCEFVLPPNVGLFSCSKQETHTFSNFSLINQSFLYFLYSKQCKYWPIYWNHVLIYYWSEQIHSAVCPLPSHFNLSLKRALPLHGFSLSSCNFQSLVKCLPWRHSWIVGSGVIQTCVCCMRAVKQLSSFVCAMNEDSQTLT